jgi:uncharacterized protein
LLTSSENCGFKKENFMGPLVPDIIGNELNFVVALFIGLAFGYILEQAGFSTSKKLVGLFYGYDFTVLRVFFTAGIVAMMGVITLSHFGLLDISIIYVNPTFLWSAIVGGLIMGLGFVIGGFCPGTSVCAAAIGKIDAMVFIVGTAFGVLFFAEGYPYFEGLYKAEFWGNPRLSETLNMSQGIVAFGLVVMAIGGFLLARYVEKRVNGEENKELQPRKFYYGLAFLTLLAGLTAFTLPEEKSSVLETVKEEMASGKIDIKFIDPDELAFRLIDDDMHIQIFDFRTEKEFLELNLPKSVNLNKENLFGKNANKYFTVRKKNVFISNDEKTETEAALIAEDLGFENIYILKGGFTQFRNDILNFKMPNSINTRQEEDTYRFRTKASKLLPVLIEENKKAPIIKKASKRVEGGC